VKAQGVLGWLALVGLVAGVVMAFGIAPRELTQGNVQRIMYIHVPAVWVAYLAFLLACGASVVHLLTRRPRADEVGHAAVEVGLVFLGLNIASGSIWGKPTWGTWWTWDARITSVSIVFLIYLGYLLLRRAVDEPERAARYAAVVAIIAAPNIYLVHQSVNWWRALHQPASLLKAGGPTMPAILWLGILVNFVGFGLLATYFVARRASLLRREAQVAA
jgi:heme exporter protein C